MARNRSIWGRNISRLNRQIVHKLTPKTKAIFYYYLGGYGEQAKLDERTRQAKNALRVLICLDSLSRSCFQALAWVLLLNQFIKERARCQTIQRTILQIPAITIRKIYARKLSESSVYAPTAACA